MVDSEQPSSTAAGEPASQNLGQILRNARVAQDLSVEQLATELRIEAPRLVALEENRFEKIGAPVFVKGYLRQYGQRLGIDYRDLLALYYKQATHEEVGIHPSPTIRLRDERQITVWVVATIALAVIVVGLAVWWMQGGVSSTPASVASTASSDPNSAVAPAPQVAREPAPTEPPVAEPPAAGAVVPDALPQAASPASAPAAAPGATIPLVFTFDEESWTEVTDARGERLFYGLAASGRRAAVRGEPPFAVVLGNARAVRLLVNGEAYPVPTPGRQGGIVRFSVDIAEE
jgi:cytoskeleton protein RodZ